MVKSSKSHTQLAAPLAPRLHDHSAADVPVLTTSTDVNEASPKGKSSEESMFPMERSGTASMRTTRVLLDVTFPLVDATTRSRPTSPGTALGATSSRSVALCEENALTFSSTSSLNRARRSPPTTAEVDAPEPLAVHGYVHDEVALNTACAAANCRV